MNALWAEFSDPFCLPPIGGHPIPLPATDPVFVPAASAAADPGCRGVRDLASLAPVSIHHPPKEVLEAARDFKFEISTRPLPPSGGSSVWHSIYAWPCLSSWHLQSCLKCNSRINGLRAPRSNSAR